MRLPSVTALVLACTLSSGPAAQETGAQTGAQRTEIVHLQRGEDAPRRPFLLEPGEYTVREILEFAGEHLRRSFVAGDEQTPRQTESTVTVRFPLHLDEARLDRFVQRILGHAQLFATPLTVEDGAGVYQLLSIVGPRAHEVVDIVRFVPLEDVLGSRDGHELVMTIVPVRNADAQQLGSDLRMFAPSHGGRLPQAVHGSATGRAILLQGPISKVAELADLAQALDAVAARSELGIDRRVEELTRRLAEAEAAIAALRESAGGSTGSSR